MMPPVVAHNDIVVYEDETEHTLHTSELDNIHNQNHHQNNCDDEENRNHHHHCSIEILQVTVFKSNEQVFEIKKANFNNKPNHFYQNRYYSSYLNGIFQPPRFC